MNLYLLERGDQPEGIGRRCPVLKPMKLYTKIETFIKETPKSIVGRLCKIALWPVAVLGVVLFVILGFIILTIGYTIVFPLAYIITGRNLYKEME